MNGILFAAVLILVYVEPCGIEIVDFDTLAAREQIVTKSIPSICKKRNRRGRWDRAGPFPILVNE